MAQKPLQYNDYSPGSRGPLEVLIGSDWRRLPKIRNVGFSATAATESSIEYVDQPTETRSGSSGPGNVTYDLTRAPAMEAYRTCYDGFKVGSLLTFRDYGGVPVEYKNPSTATSDTIAVVGATGLLTLAGTLTPGTADAPASPFIPGRVLVLGAKAFTLEEVTASGVRVSRLGAVSGEVATPDSVALADETATATWSIVQYGTRREFTGRVTEMGAYTRGSNNEGQVDRMTVNVQVFPDDVLIVADN